MKKYILIAVVLLTSCKPVEKLVYREVPVEVPRISIQKDTIRERTTDSVFMSVKGDTVRIERYKTLYKDRVSIKTDTVTKTVTLKETTTKTVTKWGLFDWIGVISLVAFGGYLFLKFRK